MPLINEPTISPDEIVRPTLVEVDLARLARNFQAIRSQVAPARVMPILKANAYGHGLLRVAQQMESLGADYLGVAVLEEGILLRQNGIHMPILVLGGILGNQVPGFLKHDLTITASSIDKLLQVDEIASQMGVKAKVHLKIDTGMERIGVHYYNAGSFIETAFRCASVDVEGIYSHFANADQPDLKDAKRQLERFEEVLTYFDKHSLPPPPLRHMANSPAILQLPEARFDMVRPGLLLYGVYPSQDILHSIHVSPALSWKSRVVYFKVIMPGHPVGYGSTWQPDHMVRAVTAPVGYGDGYFRSMTHHAQVLLHGKKYPVVGRISMDQIVINIEWDSAYNDDEVVLIGESGGESITCENLAEWAGTIPYEVLTNINTRVPRVYLND